MTTLQLALVLVASIWAAVNTVIAGYGAVNGTRDRILTGRTDEGTPLTLEHRQLMYRNDWIPLKLGLGLVSLAFAGFLVLLPELTVEPTLLRAICYVAALLPFFSFLGFVGLGLADRRVIVRTLRGARAAVEDVPADGTRTGNGVARASPGGGSRSR